MNKIRFLGDWAPGYKSVFMHEVDQLFLLNIEGPLVKNKKDNHWRKINKSGPHLLNESLPKNKNFIAILSNNHLMDYGEDGMNSTINILNEQGIRYVGAGKSREEAEKPLVFSIENSKFALFARCEKQFGIASHEKSGIAELEIGFINKIKKWKEKVDFIIVSIHGGAEMLPWPSPKRQNHYKSLIDMGVDIVYGHHSHVPQGWEKYKKGVIFYGLGNFCIDLEKWQNEANIDWSLTPVVSFEKNQIEVIEEISIIEMQNSNIYLKETNFDERKKFKKYIELSKKPLIDPELLTGIWQEFSLRNYNKYYSKWLGLTTNRKHLFNFILKIFILLMISFIPDNKIKLRLKKIINNKFLLIYHLFSCDAHADAIETALGLISGETKNLINNDIKSIFDNQRVNI